MTGGRSIHNRIPPVGAGALGASGADIRKDKREKVFRTEHFDISVLLHKDIHSGVVFGDNDIRNEKWNSA